MTIGVYDNAGTNIESTRGPYSISISLTPAGTFSGSISGNTSAGTLVLSNLRILSAGTYTITAACTGVTSVATASFTNINYAYQVTLGTSISTPTVNFSFTITATIKGEDLNSFTGICSATLSESSSTAVYGTTTGSNTSGTLSFSIYLVATGAKTIVVTCPAIGSSPAVSGTIGVTLLQEILKITSFTPTVRFYVAGK